VIVGSKEPMQRWFMKRRLPCLVIGSCGSDVTLPSVDVDYHAACRHAAGVLWRRGHRRLALVLPRDAFGGDVESEMGLEEGLTGLAGASVAVLRHDGSSSHLVRLMNARMANRETAPTAYFVAGADHAITVLTHLARMGKRVPRDVAVLCRDDEPMLRAVVPAMARYTFDRRAFAKAVAGVVRRLAESAGVSSEAIRIQPLLIEGETIG
jgi:DNA-binding LacI/PurR family transcriptional regulator